MIVITNFIYYYMIYYNIMLYGYTLLIDRLSLPMAVPLFDLKTLFSNISV